MVIIPCQPSPYDIWAAADLVDVIKARQDVTDGKPKAAFVVSRAIKNTKLGKEILDALEGYELPILKALTTQRVAYPTTAAEGKTVFIEAESEAAREIQAPEMKLRSTSMLKPKPEEPVMTAKGKPKRLRTYARSL